MTTSQQASAFLLANFDVFQNGFHRAFIHYRAHVWVLGGIAYGDLFDSGFQSFDEFVIDAFIDDGARTSRTFLSRKAEGRQSDTFDGGIEVSIGINDDGIFAAHFQNGTFDPDLAGRHFGGTAIDVQPDLARAGECNVAGLGMRDHGISEARPRTGTEIYDAFRHAGFLQGFDKLGGDGGRVT